MAKLWEGRLDGASALTDSFNSSIGFDKRLYFCDITGSVAHAEMLGRQGIIPAEDAEKIVDGLTAILADINDGKLEIDMSAEDIHTFVEQELTKRIGDSGKMLHTARSRNDQVALDLRMYLIGETECIVSHLRSFIGTLAEKASRHTDTVMPGYTHMQRAQPVTFAHWLLAYCSMFERDIGRLTDGLSRLKICPIGSCALAGTTYGTDRFSEAKSLGFDVPCVNSLDGVSDRDFCVEFLAACSLIMVHLSRMCEELIYWSGSEFGFITMDNAFSTGSSIMPQKKNPDVAELARGKTGRVFGDLMAMLTVLKGIPLAYNKDLQEDKEAVFDAADTVRACLTLCEPMCREMKVNAKAMREACAAGYINATDCADYLTKKGIPFRDAYKITGKIIAYCAENGTTLEKLPLEVYGRFSEGFAEDIYDAVNIENCAARRASYGGPAPEAVTAQIEHFKALVNN